MTSAASRDGLPVGRLIKLMFVLWLAGVAMRVTILAMPPVIPPVHDELHMSETQVGLLIAPVFFLLSPKTDSRDVANTAIGGQWWPDWKNPVVWLLGLAFGSNNSAYFSTNAFLGDFLTSNGKPELLGLALAWLNGAQIITPIILLTMADRMQRQAWPFLIFGPILLGSFLLLMFVPPPLS